MTTFTASEVRESAIVVVSRDMEYEAEMLRAFADRLEADERSMPVAWLIEYDFNPASAIVTNSKAVVDGLRSERNRIAPLYTHPAPADAERLAEALRAKIRRLRNMPKGEFQLAASIFADDLESILDAHYLQLQLPAASVPDEDARDAARYRHMIETSPFMCFGASEYHKKSDLDEAIDDSIAAMAKESGR